MIGPEVETAKDAEVEEVEVLEVAEEVVVAEDLEEAAAVVAVGMVVGEGVLVIVEEVI